MEENEKHWPPAPRVMLPERKVTRRATSLTGYSLLDAIFGFFIGLFGLSLLFFLTSALIDGLLHSGDTATDFIEQQEQLFCGWIFIASLFAIVCRGMVRHLKVFGIASAIGGFVIIALLTWYYSDWFPIVFLGAPLSSAKPGS